MDHLINHVQEKGIVNIVNGYKDDLEFKDILKKYTYINNIVCWLNLSHEEPLTLDFLLMYEDQLNWELVSRNIRIKFTLQILRHFKDKLNWIYITDKFHITDKFLDEFHEYVNWRIVSIILRNKQDHLLVSKWKDYLILLK